jgi:hypothetical protein
LRIGGFGNSTCRIAKWLILKTKSTNTILTRHFANVLLKWNPFGKSAYSFSKINKNWNNKKKLTRLEMPICSETNKSWPLGTIPQNHGIVKSECWASFWSITLNHSSNFVTQVLYLWTIIHRVGFKYSNLKVMTKFQSVVKRWLEMIIENKQKIRKTKLKHAIPPQ